MKEIMLGVENLSVSYGAIEALHSVSLEVERGELVSLIGANGAGKTTILRTITGLLPAKSGQVFYKEHNLLRMPARKIVTLGLAHIPEGRHIFSRMTVSENLKMGAYFRKDQKEIAADLQKVYDSFPRLKERKTQPAGTLSGGEQQMLAMGRAILSRPDMIVMDEPSMGLSPLLVQDVFSIVQKMNREGITILLVEQNAKQALRVSDRGYVLENGTITLGGNAYALLKDERVRKAYLGA